MSELPFEDGPWMPTAPSAEEEYLASLEPNPLYRLTDRQRLVLELRYGLRDGVCYTQREVAALMGIARSTVNEYEQAAKKKLGYPRKTPAQKA